MNNQTIEPEIGPCPFCHGECVLVGGDDSYRTEPFRVECTNNDFEQTNACGYIGRAFGGEDGEREAIEAHNRLSRLAEQERWIPVEEPPEMGTRCLLVNGENVGIATYMGKAVGGAEWKMETTGFHGEIHYASEPKIWQPLPLPPSKG